MKIRLSLKDPEGIAEFLYDRKFGEPIFSEEEKDYLIETYFRGIEYITLEYDLETKELSVVKRK